jgi:helicase
MVGSMEPVLPDLVAHRLVEKKGTRLVMTPLARVMAEHFIGMERLLEVVRLTEVMDEPVEIIAELESEDVHKEKKTEIRQKEPGRQRPEKEGPQKKGSALSHRRGRGRGRR